MTKLLFLLPSTGTVHTAFMTSMVGLTQALQRKKIPFLLKPYEFSDLVMSRNFLASYFLSQDHFTHALMLDSDLSFDSSQFFRLLEFDHDFTAAVYPDRRVTEQVLRRALSAATAQDLKDGRGLQKLLAGHMKYVLTTATAGEHPFQIERKNGFHTATSVGAGFVLLKRNVVEKIYDEGHARPLPRTAGFSDFKQAHRFADFFSHLPTEDGGAYLGEDQSFCKRWRDGCGGKIWVDEYSQVSHIGAQFHYGDYQRLINPT